MVCDNYCHRQRSYRFKVDTGADVTVLPSSVCDELRGCTLKKTDIPLCGPDGTSLKVQGKFSAILQWRNNSCRAIVYVVQGLRTFLLDRDAIAALNMLSKVEAVSMPITSNTIRAKYPKLFTGLGMHGRAVQSQDS